MLELVRFSLVFLVMPVSLRARIMFRIRRDLRECHVPRRLHERPELAIGDRRAIDPEIAGGDAMNRRFLRIVLVRSHAERAA